MMFSLDSWWTFLLITAVACYLTGKVLKLLLKKLRPPYYSITEYKDNVVYVFEFPRKWTRQLLNLSPYAVKLETWLRLKRVEYQVVETNQFSKATRQIPYVRYNGEEYADTLLIPDQLTAVLDLPKDDLTPEQEGISRAFIRFVDESLSMTHFLFRYCFMAESFYFRLFRPRESNFSIKIFKFFFKKGFTMRAKFGGLGRHKQSVIGDIGKDDIRAVSKFLGEKKFLFGENINTVDCAIFGQLSHVVYLDLELPHKVVLETECTNILPYLERIKKTLWPDWDELVNHTPFQ